MIKINHKISGFTLLEVMLTMALSGIALGIIYSAYFIVQKQVTLKKQTDSKIQAISSFDVVMDRDFNQAKLVMLNNNKLNMVFENKNQLTYLFENNYVLRCEESFCDTFKLQVKEINANFKNSAFSSSNIIDELKIESELLSEPVEMNYYKQYDALSFYNMQEN